jgi:hypothetical protein
MIPSAPAKLLEGKRGLSIGNRPRCFRARQWQTWRRDAAALALWEKTTRMQAILGAQREDTLVRIAIGFTACAGAAELEAPLRCG